MNSKAYKRIQEKTSPAQVLVQGRAKIKIALARGKKLYDKRADIAAKDARRAAERDYKMSFK